MLINYSYPYKISYDSTLLRGTDDEKTPRPWNLTHIIKSVCGNNKELLDVGCGTAFKLIPLSQFFKKIVAVDPNEEMRRQANANMARNHIKNIAIKNFHAENISLLGNRFDVITTMLARFSPYELHKCIKNNGDIIIEYIGCEDKIDFKKYFGKDSSGWRGQFMNYSKNEYLKDVHTMFSAFFKDIVVKNGFWRTFYTKKGLLLLLKNTPTIRNFSDKDIPIYNKIVEHMATNDRIMLTQNRILIHAKNIK